MSVLWPFVWSENQYSDGVKNTDIIDMMTSRLGLISLFCWRHIWNGYQCSINAMFRWGYHRLIDEMLGVGYTVLVTPYVEEVWFYEVDISVLVPEYLVDIIRPVTPYPKWISVFLWRYVNYDAIWILSFENIKIFRIKIDWKYNFTGLFHYSFWLSFFGTFGQSFSTFKTTFLAKDHWWGCITRKAHMVHIFY